MSEPLTGQVLASRYQVGARLGSGAMGTVYRCDHVKVKRPFAVKVLSPSLTANPKHLRRFQREAELAGKLRHPNVVGVIDVGATPEGMHYLVMEYAEGPTLGHIIEQCAPMTPHRVIELVRQMCAGLHHAHDAGMIHRDLKPDNVIVEASPTGEYTVRILDFGIAILLEDAQLERDRLTTAGLVLGTPEYMAPEHAMGATIDHRIDLFALGVIMYEMLTGKMPYEGSGVDVARANLMTPTPPMARRVPDLDVDPLLEAFTRALMEKAPDARIPSAKAALDLLDLIATDRDTAASVFGVVLPAKVSSRRPAATAPPAPRGPDLPSQELAVLVAAAAPQRPTPVPVIVDIVLPEPHEVMPEAMGSDAMAPIVIEPVVIEPVVIEPAVIEPVVIEPTAREAMRSEAVAPIAIARKAREAMRSEAVAPIAIAPEPTAPAAPAPARPTLISEAIEPFEVLVPLPVPVRAATAPAGRTSTPIEPEPPPQEEPAPST
ncbi:MAG: protein kinase, partial [Deltaproteobacteria bacterium]|nr:protein kinase [Deltaproteobacteria bacterium]